MVMPIQTLLLVLVHIQVIASLTETVDAPTRIEVRPYGASPEYLVAEVYRGIEIEVVYSCTAISSIRLRTKKPRKS
jgi:hypothetical protein